MNKRQVSSTDTGQNLALLCRSARHDEWTCLLGVPWMCPVPFGRRCTPGRAGGGCPIPVLPGHPAPASPKVRAGSTHTAGVQGCSWGRGRSCKRAFERGHLPFSSLLALWSICLPLLQLPFSFSVLLNTAVSNTQQSTASSSSEES